MTPLFPPPPPPGPPPGPAILRRSDGRLKSGTCGRPKGSSNAKTIAGKLFDEMIAGDGPAIVTKAIEVALSGDSQMLIHMLSRLTPMRKGRPLELGLPPIQSTQDALLGIAKITKDVSAGKLSPEEGSAVCELLKTYVHMADTVELQARIEALEKAQAERSQHLTRS